MWQGVAIGAAVLAAAIDIDARGERDIRAVVVGDDGGADVRDELRARGRILGRVIILAPLAAHQGEAVRRIRRHAAPANCLVRLDHGPSLPGGSSFNSSITIFHFGATDVRKWS